MKRLPLFLACLFMRMMLFSLSLYSLTYFSARLKISLREVFLLAFKATLEASRLALISSRVFLFLRKD